MAFGSGCSARCVAGPVGPGDDGSTAHGARVSLVYTPPHLRRQGYASAAVSNLTARLLAEGSRHCCIYTDLSNPTSNHVYPQVGYRAACDFAHVDLV